MNVIRLFPEPKPVSDQIDELVEAFRRAGPITIEISQEVAMELFEDPDPSGRPVCLRLVDGEDPC